ncbi:MAG: hypothetical protein RLZZ387_5737 [Chloroflexota bacterium]|jgi:uncharacterized membrane protein
MHPLHPFTVHLPIGLLIGNALLTLIYLRRGDRSYEVSAFHCLWLGWLLLLPAVATGVWDAARQLLDPANPHSDALPWVNAHAAATLALMMVYWQAWQLRRRRPDILDDPHARGGYLARLAAGAVLVLLVGWLGGQLVYVHRLGVN